MSEVPSVTTPRFERNREGVPRTARVPLMVVFPYTLTSPKYVVWGVVVAIY
jgi:hypothetical protein